ncbi:MAG TPA: thioesterase family protein [Candidatus Acidoferrales bacterium]
MFQHQTRIIVQWSDCDPAGIVFFPNYLRWCDDCTSNLFAAAGFPFHTLFPAQKIIGVPIVDVRIQFKTSAAFGAELLVKTSVAEFRRSSFVVQHHFYKHEVLVADGQITRVWTAADPAKPGAMKSRPLPKEIVERLSSKS